MLKIIAYVIIKIPVWLVQFGGLYLRFKTLDRNAGGIFHRELCAHGLDEAAASQLTEVYLNTSHFTRLFRK